MLLLVINKSVVRGIAIPNYSNAKGSTSMIFITNKYTRIYFSIIENARSRILPKEVYREKHHIIPRCMNGTDDLTNIVSLTAREHLLCHKLLVKMTEGPVKGKLSFAVLLMAGQKSNSEIYDSIKKIAIEYAREYNKGKVPITDGKICKFLFKGQILPDGFSYGWSEEYLKKKIGNNKGKIYITNGSDYRALLPGETMPVGWYYGQLTGHKEKNSRALSGQGNPMYGKFGENHPAYGYRHSNEARKHQSESKIGDKNPMYDKVPANAKSILINGVVYNSMAEAKRITGLGRRTIENLYKQETL